MSRFATRHRGVYSVLRSLAVITACWFGFRCAAFVIESTSADLYRLALLAIVLPVAGVGSAALAFLLGEERFDQLPSVLFPSRAVLVISTCSGCLAPVAVAILVNDSSVSHGSWVLLWSIAGFLLPITLARALGRRGTDLQRAAIDRVAQATKVNQMSRVRRRTTNDLTELLQLWSAQNGFTCERTETGWKLYPRDTREHGASIGVGFRPNEHGPIEVTPSDDRGWYDCYGCSLGELTQTLAAAQSSLAEFRTKLSGPYQGLP